MNDIFEGKLFLDLNICIKVWEDVKGILGRLKSYGIRHGGVGGKVIRLTWRGGETRGEIYIMFGAFLRNVVKSTHTKGGNTHA